MRAETSPHSPQLNLVHYVLINPADPVAYKLYFGGLLATEVSNQSDERLVASVFAAQ